MNKTWILDVLADIKSFAGQNNLPVLEEHLEDTLIIAMAELASKEGQTNAIEEFSPRASGTGGLSRKS